MAECLSASLSLDSPLLRETEALIERDGMSQQPVSSNVPLKTEHVVLMAIGTGSIVANIYYIQPLLSLIASHFTISATSAGTVAMLSQLGTALGMLFFVPLGDTKERRGLIVKLLLAACICLVAMATARNSGGSRPLASA